jgi:hypothetical protein
MGRSCRDGAELMGPEHLPTPIGVGLALVLWVTWGIIKFVEARRAR